jgi:hypothetical protein
MYVVFWCIGQATYYYVAHFKGDLRTKREIHFPSPKNYEFILGIYIYVSSHFLINISKNLCDYKFEVFSTSRHMNTTIQLLCGFHVYQSEFPTKLANLHVLKLPTYTFNILPFQSSEKTSTPQIFN